MPAIPRLSLDRPGTFTIVGQAYVYGTMNDELWSQIRRDQMQEFVLS